MDKPIFKNYTLQHIPIPVPFYNTSPKSKLKASSGLTTLETTKTTTDPSIMSSLEHPQVDNVLITFPTSSILLMTLNRPKQLNCINSAMHIQLDALLSWYDNHPTLRCAIITGTGRAFCAGADLKEWNGSNTGGADRPSMPPSGFGALSRRDGKKPVLGAVNGICFGGGCEIIVNLDIVVAAESATISLPEVKRGVIALAGALPRLVRTVGKQRAMEMALTGRTLSAAEAEKWGLVNRVVPNGDEVKECIRIAEEIAANSPDSVICTREGIKIGWESLGAEEGSKKIGEVWYPKMDKGENMIEGVKAFVEKRKPVWVPSKL